MSTTKLTPDVIERMADRVSKVSERFVNDIEKQIHLIDKRIKAFVDQGETATTKLVETLDREMRSQITTLRKEVERLSAQIVSMRREVETPKPLARPAVKRTTTRSSARPPVRPAVKRTTTRSSARPPVKATTRKAPAKRAAA